MELVPLYIVRISERIRSVVQFPIQINEDNIVIDFSLSFIETATKMYILVL